MILVCSRPAARRCLSRTTPAAASPGSAAQQLAHTMAPLPRCGLPCFALQIAHQDSRGFRVGAAKPGIPQLVPLSLALPRAQSAPACMRTRCRELASPLRHVEGTPMIGEAMGGHARKLLNGSFRRVHKSTTSGNCTGGPGGTRVGGSCGG